MHAIDKTHLPILVVHTIEPMLLVDVQAIVNATAELIVKKEPFALVIINDGGDCKKRERGVNAYMMNWLKEHKADFSRLCAGVASVFPTSALLALYKPMMKLTGPRMYGCPVEVFTKLDDALGWARQDAIGTSRCNNNLPLPPRVKPGLPG